MGGDGDDLLCVEVSQRLRRRRRRDPAPSATAAAAAVLRLHLIERRRRRVAHVLEIIQVHVVVVAGLVAVLVERAAPRVHEEVGDGGDLEAELVGDGRLHLLARPLRLLEDGHQRAPLDVGEHQARLLRTGHFLFYHIVFAFAGCKHTDKKNDMTSRGPGSTHACARCVYVGV